MRRIRTRHGAAVVAALLALPIGVASAVDGSVRGRYVWGGEVHSFQPCGGAEAYWVHAGPHHETLVATYAQLTTKPYEPLCVELRGTIGPVPEADRDGFAGDYDGIFTIQDVVDVIGATGDCCPAATPPA